MSDIEFIYNGQSLIIQSNPEEIMKEISLKFATKIGKDLTELLFLYKGNQLNMNSKLNEIQSNSEEIKILVYDNGYTEKLILKFNLTDKDNILYYITLDLSFNFDIIVEYKDSFPNKIYKNSFTLNELKNKSKFFKMYDNIRECYEDINSLLDQKSFFIQKKDKTLILSIKIQLGINYNIDFPLKEEPLDINGIIYELYEKYSIVEKSNKELILKNENLEKKYIDLKLKNEDLERNNNILISKYESLEKNYQELKEKNINFEDKINELYKKNDCIEKKYNKLLENKENSNLKNIEINRPKEYRLDFDNKLINNIDIRDNLKERILKKILDLWKVKADKLGKKYAAEIIIKNWRLYAKEKKKESREQILKNLLLILSNKYDDIKNKYFKKWKDIAQKIKIESAKERITIYIKNRFKISIARKNWEKLSKYLALKNRNNLLHLIQKIKKYILLNKFKNPFIDLPRRTFISKLKEIKRKDYILEKLENIILKRNNTNNEILLRNYFSLWKDIVNKIEYREDELKQAIEAITKNQLKSDIQTLNNVLIIKKLMYDPYAKTISFFDKIKLVKKFQFLFDNTLEDIELIFNGLNRNSFFQNCEGKDNLLFLFKDKKGNEFGGYMSSQLLKNKNYEELIIEDKNSFIFNLQNKKKFMIIKNQQAINIRYNYIICFGGTINHGNDLYIKENNTGGMNTKDYYGDNYCETTNGQSKFTLSEIKVYQLRFKKN